MRNEMSDDEFFNYLIELEDEEKIQRGEIDFQENTNSNIDIRYQLEDDFDDNNFDSEEYEDLYKIKPNSENSMGCSSYISGILLLFMIFMFLYYLCIK